MRVLIAGATGALGLPLAINACARAGHPDELMAEDLRQRWAIRRHKVWRQSMTTFLRLRSQNSKDD
jgi:hypothetical protein